MRMQNQPKWNIRLHNMTTRLFPPNNFECPTIRINFGGDDASRQWISGNFPDTPQKFPRGLTPQEG